MRPSRHFNGRGCSACLVFFALVISACAGRPAADGPPRSGASIPRGLPDDAAPRKEPRSRYGNPPAYEVFGVRYQVMPTSYGYQERGVASWYGKKFHGRATSSQEPYDMYAMTAAHKTLPLPTYVEVRNLRNNKTITVRVNDRGPFVDNRIIDLSYSAARKLDLIKDGTGLVEITAISFDEGPAVERNLRAAAPADAPSAAEAVAESPVDEPSVAVPSIAVPPIVQAAIADASPPQRNEAKIFVQVGAFGNPENARRRYTQLRDSGVSKAFVVEDASRTPALYRVRIGPIADVDQYDALVTHLHNLGIKDSHLITD